MVYASKATKNAERGIKKKKQSEENEHKNKGKNRNSCYAP